MSDERPLTARQIIERLTRLALNFYQTAKSDSPQQCAELLAFIHYDDFITGVLDWRSDLPQLHRLQRGEGNTQRLPSKKRLHVIKELEQFAAFLCANLVRSPKKRLRRTKLEGRRNLSHYACRELVRRTSSIVGIMAPVRSLSSRRGKLALPEVDMWGWTDDQSDVFLMKSRFAAAAWDRSINIHALMLAKASLLPRTQERLAEASHRFLRHVPILDFVTPMDATAMANLAACAELAAIDLQTTSGLWKRAADPQENRTVTDFGRPAPIYQFCMSILNEAWPLLSVSPDERKRLMAGDKHQDPFEEKFAKLVSEAVEHASRIAQERYNARNFDPFVGTDARSVVKDLKPPSRKQRIAWQALTPKIATRIAAAIVRQREQIIVLQDYAERLRQWSEILATQARVKPKLYGDWAFFNKYASVGVLYWARECARQYKGGIVYAGDEHRRSDRHFIEVKRLGIDILRQRYPQLRKSSPRFADVTSLQIKKVLDILYKDDAKIRRRLRKILSHFDQ